MPNATRPAAHATRWLVCLQGTARLQHDDGRVVALLRHDAAMIAHLALLGPTPRDALLHLLWGDVDAAVLRNRLRQRLFGLKQRLGVAPVVGQNHLSLSQALHWPGLQPDVDAEPILAGLEFDDLPGFSRWLAQERQRQRAVAHEWLVARVQALEAEGRLAEALPLAARAVTLDPLQEPAHRRLMRLHHLRGDRAAALQAFDACEAVLKAELGTRPSAETLALLAQIEQTRPPAQVAPVRPLPVGVLRPPRLVGRDEAWAQLHHALAQGDAVVLVGEAGLGKTRLLAELLASADIGRSLHVAARPGDEGVPYALLSRLLRGLLEFRHTPLDPGVQAELARLLPEQHPARAGATLPAGPSVHARFVNAIESALQHAADEGLQTVALDDLHFSDGASLELARHLTGSTSLRWIVALRPDAGEAAACDFVDQLTTQRRGTAIRLAPLSVAQVAELVDTLALGPAMPADLPAALHRHTGGNPLFLLETLRLLLQGGAAARGLAQLDTERLPTAAGVSRLVQGRLARLSPMAVKLVRCAAIAGQDFDVPLAAHVLGARPIDLADAWGELAAAEVLRDNAFAHDLVHDAALASVPAPIAQSLHGEVAAWLDARGGEPARIAHHWQQAGRPGLAGPAWMEAAARCGARGRRVEESQLLARAAGAFAQAQEPRRHSEALLRRADVVGQHAAFADAQKALDDAAAAVVDDEDRLRLSAIAVNLWAFHGEEARVLAKAPEALQLARRLGRHETVLQLAMPYAGALARAGQPTKSVELLVGLRDWVEAHAALDLQREYWNAFALALDWASCLRESMRVWATVIDRAERSQSDLLCQALGNMAVTSARMGAVAQAAELGERALALAQAASDGFGQQQFEQQLALGHHLRNLGRYGQAVSLLEAAAAGFRQGRGALKADTADHYLAVAWLHLGQPARALQLMATDSLSPLPRVRAMRLAFRALARQAAGQDASAPLRESLALLNEPEHPWYRTHVLIATTIVPPDEAEPLATGLASWALARERFGLALAAHARAAQAALAQGAPTRAAPHVATALNLAQDYQPDVFYLPELWWTAAQVHAALGQEGQRRTALADGARWVARTAEHHVPPEFRDSFLRRNRVNAELLGAARAAGLAP